MLYVPGIRVLPGVTVTSTVRLLPTFNVTGTSTGCAVQPCGAWMRRVPEIPSGASAVTRTVSLTGAFTRVDRTATAGPTSTSAAGTTRIGLRTSPTVALSVRATTSR